MKQFTLVVILAVSLVVPMPRIVHARPQVPITPVDFRPFSDGQHWIVKEPLTYKVGVSDDSVTVPVGFVTDLASIPAALRSLIQQNGSYLLPAVVHDYLYWKQTCSRSEADGIMNLAMIEHEVSAVHRNAISLAVQAAGGFAWDANKEERANGLIRIIPVGHLAIPPNTTWQEYRMQLMANGVEDGPDTEILPGFCKRGSMTVEEALTTP